MQAAPGQARDLCGLLMETLPSGDRAGLTCCYREWVVTSVMRSGSHARLLPSSFSPLSLVGAREEFSMSAMGSSASFAPLCFRMALLTACARLSTYSSALACAASVHKYGRLAENLHDALPQAGVLCERGSAPYERPSGRLLSLPCVKPMKVFFQIVDPSLFVMPSMTCSRTLLRSALHFTAEG